jgi:hypothetical protein
LLVPPVNANARLQQQLLLLGEPVEETAEETAAEESAAEVPLMHKCCK